MDDSDRLCFQPCSGSGSKINRSVFSQWGVTLDNVSKKVTGTLINSQSIADAQVLNKSVRQHHGFMRGPCDCSSPPREEQRGEKWRKKKLTETDKQRLKMRRKDSGTETEWDRGKEGKEIRMRGQMGFEMLIRWAPIFSSTGEAGNKNAGVEACLSLCVRLSIITVKWHIPTTYRRAARGERCVFRLSLRVIYCHDLQLKLKKMGKQRGLNRVVQDLFVCPSVIPPEQRINKVQPKDSVQPNAMINNLIILFNYIQWADFFASVAKWQHRIQVNKNHWRHLFHRPQRNSLHTTHSGCVLLSPQDELTLQVAPLTNKTM